MSFRRLALPITMMSLSLSGCGGREIDLDGVNAAGAAPNVGGSPATGGSSGTGGSPPTGGGPSTGGVGGSAPACELTFRDPEAGAVLTHRDDVSGDRCADGFQYDVEVATDAPSGVEGRLFQGSQHVGTATVSGGALRFEGVQLASQGELTLLAAVDYSTGCEAHIDIEVDCGVPSCSVVRPVVSPEKPKLNGVPASEGGDRVSALGAPFQTAFEVSTSVADGQPVVLRIDGQSAGVSALASGGVAMFPAVTLDPDGPHSVAAMCFSEEGIVGQSGEGTYTVDTVPPDLAVRKVLGGGSASLLENGDHFGPADDADPEREGLQMRICGVTTASDAVDLSSMLQAGQNNFCIGVGTSAPICVPAVTGGAEGEDGACVNVDCPGAGSFSINMALLDDAGNPTARSVESLTCASSNPSVQFLDPVSDAPPFGDVAKRILAADNVSATRRDKNPNLPGAQYDVVACTTATTGTARLLGGLAGGGLQQLASTSVVAAAAADGCPSGMTGKVVFSDVTLPESSHNPQFALQQASQLRVEVTDISNASGFAQVDVWVDSINPNLSIVFPANFCGSFIESDVDVTRSITLNTAIVPVQLRVNGGSCGATCSGGTALVSGSTVFDDVALPVGVNALTAWVTKPSTNVGRITSPCEVTVASNIPPTVAWTTPVSTNRLTASVTTGGVALPDADQTASGWQGVLRVCTNIDPVEYPGATVQFAANGQPIGGLVTVEADGCAELGDATVPEGLSVQLQATTSEVDGVEGVATINVPVDVTPPGPIANVTPAVLVRRATSFRLAWSAPEENLGLNSYQVRVSRDPIETSADFTAATVVPYTSAPSAAGAPDSVDVQSRLIETDYYFAIVPVDFVGNRGPMVATSSPIRAEFRTAVLPAPSSSEENLGSPVDGSADLNADGFSDIIAGNLLASNVVRIFFGSASGPSSSGPTTTITGFTSAFGAAVAALDLDGDGRPEVVVGSPNENAVYVFRGRATWPATLSAAQADTVIRLDSTLEPLAINAGFGRSLARLGDFNGNGRQDLAIGAPFYDSGRGLVAVVLGQSGGLGSVLTLPTGFGASAFRFEGTPGVVGNFGWSVLGLGNFFDSARTDLVVAAPVQNLEAGTNRGAAFSFRGRSLTSATVLASEADFSFSGEPGGRVGFEGLSALGRLGPQGQPALGFPLRGAGTKGKITLVSGTAELGPFSSLLGHFRTTETTAGRLIGRQVIGGGFSGTSAGVSFIRSGAPDVVIPSLSGPRLYFFSNETLQGLASMSLDPDGEDLSNHADLEYWLPEEALPWLDFGRNVTAARDVDGDGYGDLLMGSVSYGAPADGKILVVY